MTRLFHILIITLTVSIFCPAYANSEPTTLNQPNNDPVSSFVYFTGVGCPHCANTDPVILKEKIRENNFLIIEYEIYQTAENSRVMLDYKINHGINLSVPTIVISSGKKGSISGDKPILKNLDNLLEGNKNNKAILPKTEKTFEELNLTDLPTLPKIWFKDRIAIRIDKKSEENETIKQFLLNGTLPTNCEPEENSNVALSGDNVTFNHACHYNGWLLMND